MTEERDSAAVEAVQAQEAKAQEARDLAERLKIVETGIDAEAFVQSALGRYIVKRSEEERERAVTALIEADASDVNKVRALQLDIRVIDAAQQYIADAISEGQAMAEALVEEEAHRGPPDSGPPES